MLLLDSSCQSSYFWQSNFIITGNSKKTLATMLFDWHEIARLSQVVETSQSLEVAPGMTARSLVSTQTPSFQTNIPAQRVPVFLHIRNEIACCCVPKSNYSGFFGFSQLPCSKIIFWTWSLIANWSFGKKSNAEDIIKGNVWNKNTIDANDVCSIRWGGGGVPAKFHGSLNFIEVLPEI